MSARDESDRDDRAPQEPRSSRPAALLARWVSVEPGEVTALLASFAMFFAILSAYYIIRPLRDEMGVTLGKDALHRLFTVVFFVMLAAVPLFGFMAARFPRRRVLPAIYLFFAANLIVFWLVFKIRGSSPVTAATFFVWASVFNLFVVSLFWSLMAELWSNGEAKRLYGFISAGGTAGALSGPLLTKSLIGVAAPLDLLLLSAALLSVALAAGLILRRERTGSDTSAMHAAGGGILDGAAKVFASPYFFKIPLYVFLANIAGTFFYLEQSRLVGIAITDSAERVKFFANRDLMVSVATLTIELFGTAFVMRRLGVTAALLALPMTALMGTLALTSDPSLLVVAAVLAAERVAAFSLSSPAIKVMYTLTSADEKYKVQNFVDTVVYRGGDAASGWIFSAVSGGAGFAAAATPLIVIPLTLGWLWTARDLGRAHKKRAAVPVQI